MAARRPGPNMRPVAGRVKNANGRAPGPKASPKRAGKLRSSVRAYICCWATGVLLAFALSSGASNADLWALWLRRYCGGANMGHDAREGQCLECRP
eukprot:3135810-Pyramimonas_sp.AAC.1